MYMKEIIILLELLLDKIYFYINKIIDMLLLCINSTIPLIPKILDYIFKHLLITCTFCILSSLLSYSISPILFKYSLSYFGININDISIIENLNGELNSKNTELENLKETLEEFKKKRNELEVEASKAIAEKEGLLKSFKHIQKDNWWIIIGTTAIMTVVLGGVCYYIFYSDGNVELFKPVIDHITDASKCDIKLLRESITVLNTKLENIDIKILRLTDKIIETKNVIDTINPEA